PPDSAQVPILDHPALTGSLSTPRRRLHGPSTGRRTCSRDTTTPGANLMNKHDQNPDPITGAPGSHPVGVAAGGTAGAIAGAAIGSFFGPLGTLIGGGIGAVGGASGGKAIAERVDPTAEVEYWRQDATGREYYRADADFDRDYAPAYRLRSEEHTSELQSRENLVCRLLLE